MTWRARVVVTAHNAAQTIDTPLRAIARQAVSRDTSVQVTVVDDRSDDGTAASAAPHLPAGGTLLQVTALPPHGVSARQAALDVAAADGAGPPGAGSAVLVLDADADPPACWVEGMRHALAHADLVSWPLAFEPADGSHKARAIALLQTADVAFYLTICRWLTACGCAAGVCFGAAGWRTQLYRKVGGFRALGFTLTEDLAFARAAHAAGARIVYPAGPSVRVRAATSWDALLERALRVSAAGGVSALSLSLGIGVATLAVTAAVVAAGLASPWWLAARWLGGTAVVLVGLRRGRATAAWPAALCYEAAATVTAVQVLVRRSKRRGVEWGGARYDAGYASPPVRRRAR